MFLGENKGWKQESDMGTVSNQNFVQLSFDMIKNMISYRAEVAGIRVIYQEENYTSKTSFVDRDFIPVYGKDGADEVRFSGKRKPTHYKEMYKKDGFSGLYKTSDGTIINSDLNGGANIMRKALPNIIEEAFPRFFTDCIIINHPDEKEIKELKKNRTNIKQISKSKQKRLNRKLAK